MFGLLPVASPVNVYIPVPPKVTPYEPVFSAFVTAACIANLLCAIPAVAFTSAFNIVPSLIL